MMKNMGEYEKENLGKKIIMVYIVIAVLCVLTVITAVVVVIRGPENSGPTVNEVLNYGSITKEEEEQELKEQELISDFEELYLNGLEVYGEALEVLKEKEEEEIVYTLSAQYEKENGEYEVEINIPYINIDNEVAAEQNERIVNEYITKAREIIEIKENSRMLLKYQASIQNGVLSLIIHTELKEGLDAQRLFIETINYDLETNELITLEEYIEKVGELDKEEVQEKITDEVTSAEQEDAILRELGYEIYRRDLESGVYLLENTEYYYIYDGVIYIIYPYGNLETTRKTDVVVIF